MQDLGGDAFPEPKQSATPTDAISRTAMGLGLVEGEDCRSGLRNSLLVAPMPTVSTSQIYGGVTSTTLFLLLFVTSLSYIYLLP